MDPTAHPGRDGSAPAPGADSLGRLVHAAEHIASRIDAIEAKLDTIATSLTQLGLAFQTLVSKT